MLEGKVVVRVVKDVTGDLDESLLEEIFVVLDHFPEDEKNAECVRVDASTVNKSLSKLYDLYQGEYEVLTDEEVKEILFKKFTRLGEKMLSL